MFARIFGHQKPKQPTHIDVSHAGSVFRVLVKRVAAARRYTLRVRVASRDVVLTMPQRGTFSAAREFALRHAEWIDTRLKVLPGQSRFVIGTVVPVRGIEHLIVHRPNVKRTIWIERNGAGDTSTISMQVCVSGDIRHVERRVQDYLKRESKRDIEAAVAYYTRKIGKAARRITLKDTTSRWGSCSSKGSLNFSWRLVLAPSFVLDYVAAHEVAHLVHMNHAAAFWTLTKSLVPDFERAEIWLKTNGAGLHRFGV